MSELAHDPACRHHHCWSHGWTSLRGDFTTLNSLSRVVEQLCSIAFNTRLAKLARRLVFFVADRVKWLQLDLISYGIVLQLVLVKLHGKRLIAPFLEESVLNGLMLIELRVTEEAIRMLAPYLSQLSLVLGLDLLGNDHGLDLLDQVFAALQIRRVGLLAKTAALAWIYTRGFGSRARLTDEHAFHFAHRLLFRLLKQIVQLHLCTVRCSLLLLLTIIA